MEQTRKQKTLNNDSPLVEGAASQATALVARKPIFDLHYKVFGYELLFRDPAMQPGFGGKTPDAASATVLTDGFELMRPTLRSGQRLFINCTEEVLESELPTLLPSEICAVEILENVKPTTAVLQAVYKLKQQGYLLALDDYIGQHKLAEFLPLVDIVKVDVSGKNEDELRRLVDAVHPCNAMLLAEKVEDLNTMRLCRELPFSLFQGFFFAKPKLIKGKKLSPPQKIAFRLMSFAADEKNYFNNVAEAIAADVHLTYRLLRYINSVYFGLSTEIHSIKQAVTMLGQERFYSWLCVTILAELNAEPIAGELAYISALRGKFLETLALRSGNAKQQRMSASLLLIGLFSLMESIMNIPMEEALAPLPLEEAVREALTKGAGPYMPWLSLVNAYERGEWRAVNNFARQLELTFEDLKAGYAEAISWTSNILN